MIVETFSKIRELRNSALGNIFKKLAIIEQWGTGFDKAELTKYERSKFFCSMKLMPCGYKVANDLKDYADISLEIDDSSSFTQVRFVKTVGVEGANVGVNVGANDVFNFIQENQPVRVVNIKNKFNSVT